MSLPGVQEAADERDWERARSQLALLTKRFQPNEQDPSAGGGQPAPIPAELLPRG